MTPEFSRPLRIDTIGSDGRSIHVEADAAERAALAKRFDLVAIDRLEAEVTLSRNDSLVFAKGRIEIRAVARVSLNDRSPQLLIFPDVDLAAVQPSLLPARWIRREFSDF